MFDGGTTQGPFYIYALVMILFGLPLGLDALLRLPSSYRKVGLHKWKWALTALVSNLLFLGPVFGVVYLFWARRKIKATKPRSAVLMRILSVFFGPVTVGGPSSGSWDQG